MLARSDQIHVDTLVIRLVVDGKDDTIPGRHEMSRHVLLSDLNASVVSPVDMHLGQMCRAFAVELTGRRTDNLDAIMTELTRLGI